MSIAFISMGSNQGDPVENIQRAMSRLEALSCRPLLRSSLWQTSPVDCPPGSPRFVNAVVGLYPGPEESPESLLEKLRSLEKEFGRKPKSVLNEPRPLDLDLIAFGAEVRHTCELILPHPRAHVRRFVLAPLSEIAPDFRLPEQPATVRELCAAAPADPGLARL